MYLPESMLNMRITEWNHAVKGIVEVWELARLLGLDQMLERRLQSDDGTLAMELGALGNDFLHVTTMVRRSAVVITLAHSGFLLDLLNTAAPLGLDGVAVVSSSLRNNGHASSGLAACAA